MRKILIIDFDSTINKLEGLDELAKIIDHKNGNTQVSEKIKEITDLGMQGEISFTESLNRRMELLNFDQKDLEQLITHLKQNFTDSFINNISKLEEMRDDLIIISGGFKDFIVPCLSEFKFKTENIYANEFIFNKTGVCSGINNQNLLAKDLGKYNIVKSLNLEGELYIIGDGYTDYQIKELGAADKFIAFTENVARENIIRHADYVAKNFGEVLESITD